MRLVVVVVVGLVGCGNPVDTCDNFPRTDCCREHGDCFEFYGPEFPICSRPEQDGGGICSECARDFDCKASQVCQVDGGGWGQCIDPDACYEGTPWPDTTGCR